MANTIHVEIVSAEGNIFSGEANMLVAAAEGGDVGIAPGHAAYISRLKPGEVRVLRDGEEEQPFYISGGIIEVQPKSVTVLSDTAVRAHDLDEAQALQAQERARSAMADKQSAVDYAKAQLELQEAVAQLQTIQRLRKQR